MKMILHIFLIVFIISFAKGDGCDIIKPNFGTLTPDHDLEVGSTLSLNCTLSSLSIPYPNIPVSVNSSHLLYKFNGTIIPNPEILDAYTSQLIKDSTTVNDSGSYYCYVQPPGLKRSLICLSYINVGYKPKQVTDIKCTSENFEKLTCEWKSDYNPVKPKFTLIRYLTLSGFRPFQECPKPLSDTSCQWRLDTRPPYLQSSKNLYLSVIAENSLGKSYTNITIDHYKQMIPHKPKDMMFTDITKHSLRVTWLPANGLIYDEYPPGLTYELHYEEYNHPENTGKIIEVFNKTSVQIDNLIPYTVYKFSLHCRGSIVEREDRWSPYLNKTARTKHDKPYDVPEVIREAFEVQNLHNYRNIRIYWNPVPLRLWNGRDFGYYSSVTPIHILRSRRETENGKLLNGYKFFEDFISMESNTAYQFYIYSENEVGRSDNSSSLIIPKASKMPSPPEQISVIYYGNEKYVISWEPPKIFNFPIISYTVFWCKSFQRPSIDQCKEALQWLSVPSSSLSVEIKLLQNANHQFAVSANTEDSSSGMEWARCVALYNKVLNKIKDISLEPKNSTALKMKWKLDCNAQKALVERYEITYCEVASCNLGCRGEQRKIIIKDENTDQVYIGQLEPFTFYKARINTITNAGANEQSDFQCSQTLISAPSDAPRDIEASVTNDTIIIISWYPPHHPNGVISHYVIKFNNNSETADEYSVPQDMKHEKILASGILYYTNYTIQLQGCVNRFCSPWSNPVYVSTGIGEPESPDQPRIEVYNSTFAKISWSQPKYPNGPINNYEIIAECENDQKRKINETMIVAGNQTDLLYSADCMNLCRGTQYNFYVRAVNDKGENALVGQLSEPIQSSLCLSNADETDLALIIGITVGSAVGLVALVIVLYCLLRWMKRKVDLIKDIKVQLPSGLECPSENPVHYEHFSKGLIPRGNDSSISAHTVYGHLNSFTDIDSKGRHESGGSHYSNTSTEELLQKRNGDFGRNPSGDSGTFSKGHDSILSCVTARTQLSSDSGAESDAQAPPSPDGVLSDWTSSNTTPKSFTKSSLAVVQEGQGTSSKDSGLDKEGTNGVSSAVSDLPTNNHYARFSCSPMQQPYSKFGVTSYVSVPGHSSNYSLGNQSLANSEPSFTNFDSEEDDRSQVPLISPYTRYGLARSISGGLNGLLNPPGGRQALGYSKFGVTPNGVDDVPKPGDSPEAFTPYVTANFAAVLLDKNNPFEPHCFMLDPLTSKNTPGLKNNTDLILTSSEKSQATFSDKLEYSPNRNLNAQKIQEALNDLADSSNYSKIGIQEESQMPVSKGYVSLQHAKKLSEEASQSEQEPSENNDLSVGYSKIDIQFPPPLIATINGDDDSFSDSEETVFSPSTGAKPKNVLNRSVPTYSETKNDKLSRISSPEHSHKTNGYVPLADFSSNNLSSPKAHSIYYPQLPNGDLHHNSDIISPSNINGLLNGLPELHTSQELDPDEGSETEPCSSSVVCVPSCHSEVKSLVDNSQMQMCAIKPKLQSNGYVSLNDVFHDKMTAK